MEKVIINSYEDLEKLVGQQIGISDYVELSQERINMFADATLDHQWIHVDTERAKRESPFKSTIAHGYLTLSILPFLWNQIIEVNNLKMMVNYGMEQVAARSRLNSVKPYCRDKVSVLWQSCIHWPICVVWQKQRSNLRLK